MFTHMPLIFFTKFHYNFFFKLSLFTYISTIVELTYSWYERIMNLLMGLDLFQGLSSISKNFKIFLRIVTESRSLLRCAVIKEQRDNNFTFSKASMPLISLPGFHTARCTRNLPAGKISRSSGVGYTLRSWSTEDRSCVVPIIWSKLLKALRRSRRLQ